MSQLGELIQISKTEYRIQDSKFVVLDDSIMYIEPFGAQTDNLSEESINKFKAIYAQFPGKVHHLVNLNHAGKSSPEARKFYKEFNESDLVSKTAIYGIHPVARVLASFVIGFSNHQSTRFFKTKEEALAWLKE